MPASLNILVSKLFAQSGLPISLRALNASLPDARVCTLAYSPSWVGACSNVLASSTGLKRIGTQTALSATVALTFFGFKQRAHLCDLNADSDGGPESLMSRSRRPLPATE
jgi:hypothetical protein